MKVTLRQLEIFSAIATYGQVTRAAEVVAMTQSAASMALSDLERQLGAPLFDRVGRQLVLNEAGRQLLPRALGVLDSVREIETTAGSSAAIFDLRIGASLTIGNHLLPGLLAQLQERYPGSRFDVWLRNTEQVVADLLAYRIDIGFVEGPVQDERLQRFFWRHDRLTVFVPPAHRLAGKTATQEDLADVPWILRERGSGTREVFDRALANATLPVRIAFELEQPEAIRQFVRAGLGLGCLPWLELRDACAAGWLAPVETPFLNLQRQFQAVVHRDKHLSQGIRSVLSLCGVDLV